MFGFKGLKKKDQELTDQEKKTEMFFGGQKDNNSLDYNFSVHTMEDDLVSSLNGGVVDVKEDDLKKPKMPFPNEADISAPKMNNEKMALKNSPFLEKGALPRIDLSQNIKESDSNEPLVKKEFSDKKNIGFERREKIEASDLPEKMENDFSQKKEPKMNNSGQAFVAVNSSDELAHPIEKHLNWKKVAIMSVIAVIFLSLIGGAYYLYITRKTAESQLPTEDFVADDSMTSNVPIADNSMYSSDNPNYLNLDMEVADNGSISKLLSVTFDNISSEQENSAVEFVLRDMNNNPIAFSRFAYIFSLPLPEAVLGEMDEDFSLFLIKNGGKKRIGLAVDVKDSNVAPFVLKENESNLVVALKSLFLGKEIENAGGFIFKDGSYGDVKVRYANINPADADSIDYAIWADKFLISTNKDSLRSIIDKIGAEKNSEQIVEVNDVSIPNESILNSSNQVGAGDTEGDTAE